MRYVNEFEIDLGPFYIVEDLSAQIWGTAPRKKWFEIVFSETVWGVRGREGGMHVRTVP